MEKRLLAAVIGFIGGGFLGMILLALIVSVFGFTVQNVMLAALVVAAICAVVGFCFPGVGARFVDIIG